jgi:hypothetical protein
MSSERKSTVTLYGSNGARQNTGRRNYAILDHHETKKPEISLNTNPYTTAKNCKVAFSEAAYIPQNGLHNVRIDRETIRHVIGLRGDLLAYRIVSRLRPMHPNLRKYQSMTRESTCILSSKIGTLDILDFGKLRL